MKDVYVHKSGYLAKIADRCFCLTHGNAAPERGFSKNKNVLQDREAL